MMDIFIFPVNEQNKVGKLITFQAHKEALEMNSTVNTRWSDIAPDRGKLFNHIITIRVPIEIPAPYCMFILCKEARYLPMYEVDWYPFCLVMNNHSPIQLEVLEVHGLDFPSGRDIQWVASLHHDKPEIRSVEDLEKLKPKLLGDGGG